MKNKKSNSATPTDERGLPIDDGPGGRSLKALDERADQIRKEGKRDKEGAYLPRYPGLLRPSMAGFDRKKFRTSLLDCRSKFENWCSLRKAAKILGVKVEALAGDFARLTWYGSSWNVDTTRATISFRYVRDSDSKPVPSFVIHTPDGGRAVAYFKMEIK